MTEIPGVYKTPPKPSWESQLSNLPPDVRSVALYLSVDTTFLCFLDRFGKKISVWEMFGRFGKCLVVLGNFWIFQADNLPHNRYAFFKG